MRREARLRRYDACPRRLDGAEQRLRLMRQRRGTVRGMARSALGLRIGGVGRRPAARARRGSGPSRRRFRKRRLAAGFAAACPTSGRVRGRSLSPGVCAVRVVGAGACWSAAGASSPGVAGQVFAGPHVADVGDHVVRRAAASVGRRRRGFRAAVELRGALLTQLPQRQAVGPSGHPSYGQAPRRSGMQATRARRAARGASPVKCAGWAICNAVGLCRLSAW